MFEDVHIFVGEKMRTIHLLNETLVHELDRVVHGNLCCVTITDSVTRSSIIQPKAIIHTLWLYEWDVRGS